MGLFGGMSASTVLGRHGGVKAQALKGKVALITGGNSGAGFETAKTLALAGARVIIAGRRMDAVQQAVLSIQAVIQKAGSGGSVEAVPTQACDLASLPMVCEYASAFLAHIGAQSQLHFLVLNAGVMFQPYRLTEEGFETHFATNHLGHFCLCKLLLPKMLASQPARIVVVSSALHSSSPPPDLDFANWSTPKEKGYSAWVAYGASKLANVYMAQHLQVLMNEQKADIKAVSLHPGVGPTGLGKENCNCCARGCYKCVGALFMASWSQLAGTSVQVCMMPKEDLIGKKSRQCSCTITGGAYYAGCAPAKLKHKKNEDDAVVAKRLWDKSEVLTARFLHPDKSPVFQKEKEEVVQIKKEVVQIKKEETPVPRASSPQRHLEKVKQEEVVQMKKGVVQTKKEEHPVQPASAPQSHLEKIMEGDFPKPRPKTPILETVVVVASPKPRPRTPPPVVHDYLPTYSPSSEYLPKYPPTLEKILPLENTSGMYDSRGMGGAPVSRSPPRRDKVGIGLLLGTSENGMGQDVQVCEIIPGLSAEESDQFDVGDVVLFIDGVLVRGMPLAEVKILTIGEVGTTVTLIMRSLTEGRDYRVVLTRKAPEFVGYNNAECVRTVYSPPPRDSTFFTSEQSLEQIFASQVV